MKAEKKKSVRKSRTQYRFGIGEWYGRSFAHLSAEERRFYSSIQLLQKSEKPPQPCPFLSRNGKAAKCWKPGGICSLRSYQRSAESGEVALDTRGSTIRTTCPSRFEEAGAIYRWIGETILGDEKAVAIGETPFLERLPGIQSLGATSLRKVGRIDNVLVIRGSDPLEWCPVEKQAVYFSGDNMGLEFRAMLDGLAQGLPFALKNRRPDYRSSSAKRLLPQLEIKVPTLSTWGKKMAIVVDQDFFDQLGGMREANDLSNAELAWFIVQYVEEGTSLSLRPKRMVITRLKDAIEGLIAATPVPRPKFEDAIRTKLQRLT